MKDETITIWSDGMGIILFKEVAESLGLRNGQRVAPSVANNAMIVNCEFGIQLCQLHLAIDEINAEVAATT